MNTLRVFGIFVLSLFLLARPASAQTFQNLDFEDSTVIARFFQPSGTFWTGLADVPHWTAYGYGVESNYTGGTCLSFNNQTLDSPGVFLEGTDYGTPAIAGNYSVWLLGGSIYYGGHDRASISQTGLVPDWARAVTLWTKWPGLDITFNGKSLYSTVISSNTDHIILGANIAAYAGQTGELRFTGAGMLDNIQFSTLDIPEPPAPPDPTGGIAIHLYAGLTITGAVGSVYSVQYVTDLGKSNTPAAWQNLDFIQLQTTNFLWMDKSAPANSQRYYRAVSFDAPTNMVYIPPGTFRMGSPTNEVDRLPQEGPQTTVVLTRGFWMGKYEVTQGEYLSVMGSNPSWFNGVQTNSNYVWPAGDYGTDLRRPVDSVADWHANKYCEELTKRERAAGRIPTNSVYRLPTEAEWEYACRAGTSTRFSYGDDPGYSNLVNYAWCGLNSDLRPHPVGEKLPNAWGLYDMHGNLFEWCSDRISRELPGGIVVDPKGPEIGFPPYHGVVRGGWFYHELSWLRSAFRWDATLASPIYGFRVVLAAN